MSSERTVTRRGLLAGAAVAGASGTASAAAGRESSEKVPENVAQREVQENSDSGLDAVALVAVGAAAAVGGFGGAIVATKVGGGSDDGATEARPPRNTSTSEPRGTAEREHEPAAREEPDPTCPACGAPLRSPGANFCGECGESV